MIYRVLALLTAGLLLAGCGTIRNTVEVGGHDQVMLAGNDPVSYFTEDAPQAGDPAISTEIDGVTYLFASNANRETFLSDPTRYQPQYAGYCSSGLPYALKAKIGAGVYAVVDGKLYMFGSERSRRHWMMDAEKNIPLGDSYWEDEVKDSYHRLQNLKRYVFKVDHYKDDDELEAEYQRRKAEGTLPPGV